MGKVVCYIDGFNLYHAISVLERPHLKWLNLWALSQSVLTSDDQLDGVVYFTAVARWDPEKARRHRNYIAALQYTGVEVVESHFKKSTRSCNQMQRSCAFREEKQTDVGLATRAMRDAAEDRMDAMVIVTADTDQVPLMTNIRAMRPDMRTTVALPPGRLQQAHELRKAAHQYLELDAQRLAACRLQRYVRDEDGKQIAVCPSAWLPT